MVIGWNVYFINWVDCMKDNNIVTNFFMILKRSIKFSPKLFFVKLLTAVLSSVVNILNIFYLKYLLFSLKEPNQPLFWSVLIGFTGGVLFLKSFVIFLNPYVATYNEELDAKVMDEFLKKSISIQLNSFEKKGFYNKYNLIFEKCCEIFRTVNNIFFQVVSNCIQIIVIIFILSWMDMFFVLVLAFSSCFHTMITKKIKKLNYRYRTNIIDASKKLNYLYRLFNIPEFMRDVRVNCLENFIFYKKQNISQKIINETNITQKKISNKLFQQDIISSIENIVITIYLGYMLITGKIWIDTFIAAQNSYKQLKSSVFSLFSLYNNLYENDLYTSDYLDFMNFEEEKSCGNLELKSENIEEIEFKKISFSYPNSTTYALNNVSFKIKKGEKLLITGENGSGKTSLIKLLLRLYEPNLGEILINGINITNYDIKELRCSIAALFQDYTLYAFTIYENLCLGRLIKEDDIRNALETVGLLENIEKLKAGINTPVSCQLDDEGIELSGGEKQRMAIARTALRNCSFIIYDEPTSNLDLVKKQNLIKSILSDSNKTVIMISHELFFINDVTKIMCLENGKIEEYGTHQQLIKNSSGLYSKLYANFKENKNTNGNE